jgi:cytoskeletal protein RodZ
MDIGGTLRDARERQGLSIDSLAQATKIKARILHAIERNAFDQVPAGVYTRGFLRTFAREVGLDPEEIISAYLAELRARDATQSPASGSVTADATVEAAGAPAEVKSPARLVVPPTEWQTTAIVLVVSAYLLVFAVPWRTTSRPGVSPADPSATPAPPAPDARGSATVGTSGKSIQLEISTLGPCWVSATADGQRVIYKTMQPGERQTIAVHHELDLRVGDAAAFAFSIDGVPGRSLGSVGQAVTVHMTPGNYAALLAKR